MKKRYIEEQIIKAIKRHEIEVEVDEICGDLGISAETFYKWRSKYGGLEVNDAKRLKALEPEDHKLKRMLADKLLETEAMRALLSKKWRGRSSAARWLRTWLGGLGSVNAVPVSWRA